LSRFFIFVGIVLLLSVYAAARVILRWPLAEEHWALAWSVAALLCLLPFVGPVGDRLWFSRLRKNRSGVLLAGALDWVSYTVFGILSILIAYELAVDVVTLPWTWLMPPLERSAFDQWLLAGIVAAVAVTTVVGLWEGTRRPGVLRVTIPLRNLPGRFDGFTIAQVSDLHVGPTIRARRTRQVVESVNELQPDLIALTGDFVDGPVRELASEVAPLADLVASCGVFYITGNHEQYWNAPEWMTEFRRLGATVLVNEHRLIARGDATIVLAGVSDYSTRSLRAPYQSDPKAALHGAPANLVRILLAHQPASYLEAEAAGVDLQLSGHTHAGQYFPFNLLIRYFQRYYKGLNRHGGMWIYVNRGTGYWGPPLRAGVPAEITLITLRREAGPPNE